MEFAKDLEIHGLNANHCESEPFLDQHIISDIEEKLMRDKTTLNNFYKPTNFPVKSNFKEEDYALETFDNILHNDNFDENNESVGLQDAIVRNQCENCNYTASTPSILKIHADAVHKGVRYPCDQCDYKATQKVNLKRHVIKNHTILLYN